VPALALVEAGKDRAAVGAWRKTVARDEHEASLSP
jgi:hypothetical protein